MYRRKRKRLQSQQEINPGVVLDEPGWIYFNRLNPNESPSPAPSLPPPKKKGKIVDDSSLPTPLETDPQPPENSKSILVPVKIEKATTTDKEQLILSYSKDEQQIKSNFQHNVEECNNNSKSPSSSLLEPLQKHQQQPENINSDVLNKVYSTVQQSPLDNLADAAIASFNHSSSSKNNNDLLIEQQPRHISYIPCEDSNTNNDEFTCFGRFIAVTLRKIAAHSALDALEARKAIGDQYFSSNVARPLCRYAHLNGTPGIYNTVPNWKPGPGWRPQSPQGPYLDGWAMGKERAVVTLGPQVREGLSLVYLSILSIDFKVRMSGVAHIFASFNDTFLHVTDLSGREAIVKITGGMHAALCPLPRAEVKIGRIDDVTPIPTDTTRRNGGRCGCRL
uniref:40S ribosomal protein S14 n=1 Tax=Meloidogyne javanica TaxID=6303 RepID=A0A915LJS4_MELJA